MSIDVRPPTVRAGTRPGSQPTARPGAGIAPRPVGRPVAAGSRGRVTTSRRTSGSSGQRGRLRRAMAGRAVGDQMAISAVGVGVLPLLLYAAASSAGDNTAVNAAAFGSVVALLTVLGLTVPTLWVSTWVGLLVWQNTALGVMGRITHAPASVFAVELKSGSLFALAAVVGSAYVFGWIRTRYVMWWGIPLLALLVGELFLHPDIGAVAYFRNFGVVVALPIVGVYVVQRVGWEVSKDLYAACAKVMIALLAVGAMFELGFGTAAWRSLVGIDYLPTLGAVSDGTRIGTLLLIRLGSLCIEPILCAFLAASGLAVLRLLTGRQTLAWQLVAGVVVVLAAGKGAALFLVITLLIAAWPQSQRMLARYPARFLALALGGVFVTGLAYIAVLQGASFALRLVAQPDKFLAAGNSAVYHVVGLIAAVVDAFARPTGIGLGQGGNLGESTGLDTGGHAGRDTALGALLVQLGFVGAVLLFLAIVGLLRQARDRPIALAVAVPIVAAWICGWVFQEEISGPTCAGLVLLVAASALAADRLPPPTDPPPDAAPAARLIGSAARQALPAARTSTGLTPSTARTDNAYPPSRTPADAPTPAPRAVGNEVPSRGRMHVDLQERWHGLLKRWKTVVVFLLIGGAGALYLSLTTTKQYQSDAQVFVAVNGNAVDISANQASTYIQQRVQSYVSIVTSPQVLDPVINQLGLKTTDNALGNRITAVAPNNRVLIDITVTDTSPQRAADTANAVAKQFGVTVQQLEKSISPPTVNGAPPVVLDVIHPARANGHPVSPDTNRNVLLGIAAGLLLGIAVAAVREAMDNTVNNSDQVTALTGAPVLAAVAFDKAASRNVVSFRANVHGSRAEAFRALRTNLQFVNVDAQPRVIAVTSSLPTEGKTSTAVNLAAAIAEGGYRVCLVEADLRRPTIAKVLGLVSDVGLTNVLIGQVEVEDVLQNAGMNLAVLTSGPIPPNPSELVASQNLRNLINNLVERVDFVVIDTAPLLPVTDGREIALIADATLLVVRAGKTLRSQVKRTIETLDNVGVHPVGVIMNMVPTRRSSDYSYEYSYTYAPQPEKRSSRRRGRHNDETPETAEGTTGVGEVAVVDGEVPTAATSELVGGAETADDGELIGRGERRP